MGLIRHYLRLFFRSHFRPIDRRVAHRWVKTSNTVYFVTAWTALGMTIYYCYTTEAPESDSPYKGGLLYTPYDSIRKFGRPGDNTIITIHGFSKVEKEVVTLEQVDADYKERLEKGLT